MGMCCDNFWEGFPGWRGAGVREGPPLLSPLPQGEVPPCRPPPGAGSPAQYPEREGGALRKRPQNSPPRAQNSSWERRIGGKGNAGGGEEGGTQDRE